MKYIWIILRHLRNIDKWRRNHHSFSATQSTVAISELSTTYEAVKKPLIQMQQGNNQLLVWQKNHLLLAQLLD